MAMGSTSKVVISDEMQKAKTECQNFRSQVKTFAQELDTTITTLLSSGFQGDAADGILRLSLMTEVHLTSILQCLIKKAMVFLTVSKRH